MLRSLGLTPPNRALESRSTVPQARSMVLALLSSGYNDTVLSFVGASKDCGPGLQTRFFDGFRKSRLRDVSNYPLVDMQQPLPLALLLACHRIQRPQALALALFGASWFRVRVTYPYSCGNWSLVTPLHWWIAEVRVADSRASMQ